MGLSPLSLQQRRERHGTESQDDSSTASEGTSTASEDIIEGQGDPEEVWAKVQDDSSTASENILEGQGDVEEAGVEAHAETCASQGDTEEAGVEAPAETCARSQGDADEVGDEAHAENPLTVLTDDGTPRLRDDSDAFSRLTG